MVVRDKQDGGRELSVPVECGQRPTKVGVKARFDQKTRRLQLPTPPLEDGQVSLLFTSKVSGGMDGTGKGRTRRAHAPCRRFIPGSVGVGRSTTDCDA